MHFIISHWSLRCPGHQCGQRKPSDSVSFTQLFLTPSKCTCQHVTQDCLLWTDSSAICEHPLSENGQHTLMLPIIKFLDPRLAAMQLPMFLEKHFKILHHLKFDGCCGSNKRKLSFFSFPVIPKPFS